MKQVLTILDERNLEIENVIRLIQQSENANEESLIKGFSLVRIDIKAAVVLMLYNEVEAIITDVLNIIHEQVLEDKYKYSELSLCIRKIIILYIDGIHEKSNKDTFVDNFAELIEMLAERNNVNLSYKDFNKWYQLFSGNLDSKEINKILKKYGIKEVEGQTELQTIKNMRNKLAHGEESFEEVGRQVTYQQLDVMRSRTYSFLKNVILNVDDYIENNIFLNA